MLAGKLALMPASSSPPNVSDLWGFHAVQQQVHLHQHIRQGFSLLSAQGFALKYAAVIRRGDLLQ